MTRLDIKYKNKLKIKKHNGVIVGVGGVPLRILGRIELLCKLEHHEDTFKMKFFIIGGAEYGNLLGMDFLTRFQASVQCRMIWELQIKEPRFKTHIMMMSQNQLPDEYLYTDDEDEEIDEIEKLKEDYNAITKMNTSENKAE